MKKDNLAWYEGVAFCEDKEEKMGKFILANKQYTSLIKGHGKSAIFNLQNSRFDLNL